MKLRNLRSTLSAAILTAILTLLTTATALGGESFPPLPR